MLKHFALVMALGSIGFAESTEHTGLPPSKIIIATGAGLNPDQAVQNALCTAVEQAIGLLVEAQSILDHNDILQEKVITATNGFVETYEVMSRWNKDGLQYSRIKAKVRLLQLQQVMHEQNIVTARIEGQDLAAQAETKEMSTKGASAVLKEYFSNWQDKANKILKVSLTDEVKPVGQSDSGVTHLRVPVQISVDRMQYQSLVKDLTTKLDHISRAKYTSRLSLAKQPADTYSPPPRPGQYQLGARRKIQPEEARLYCERQKSTVKEASADPAHVFFPDLWYSTNTKENIAEVKKAIDEPLRLAFGDAERSGERMAVLYIMTDMSLSGAAQFSFYLLPQEVVAALPYGLGVGMNLSCTLVAADGKPLDTRDFLLRNSHSGNDQRNAKATTLYVHRGTRDLAMQQQNADTKHVIGLYPGVKNVWRRGLDDATFACTWHGNLYLDVDTDLVKQSKKVAISASWAYKAWSDRD